MVQSEPVVKYEKKDQIAWITLNRPQAMNSLNPEVGKAMTEIMDDIVKDDDMRVVILAGEGGRAFSSGMDLKWVAQQDTGAGLGAAMGRGGGGMATLGLQQVTDCPKPIIAAIDGYCLAGGMEMASRCDIRVATEKSRFGMPEATRSLAAVGIFDTPEHYVPLGEAKWILLTGAHMTAQRAYQIGYIQALVPDREALFVEARRVAELIKKCAPIAIQVIKKVLEVEQDQPAAPKGVKRLDYLGELTKDIRQRIDKSEDRLEGPKAFAEHRDPVWKGR